MTNFLLGIGAQKCGTTWLHQQLCSSRFFSSGFCKEYHIFDSLYLDHCKHFREDLRTNLASLLASSAHGESDPRFIQYLKRALFLESLDEYFEYFLSLTRRDRKLHCVGELTPAYSMLSEDQFDHIRNLIRDHGFAPRVIFIMRDPLERLCSQIRMEIERGAILTCADSEMMDKTVLACCQNPEFDLRTRYELTVKAVDASFQESEVLYLFFEELFRAESMSSIGSFLDLDDLQLVSQARVFPSGSNFTISDQAKEEVRAHFAGTYTFIAERFGDDKVSRWLSRRQ